jgi:hypothetical protein
LDFSEQYGFIRKEGYRQAAALVRSEGQTNSFTEDEWRYIDETLLSGLVSFWGFSGQVSIHGIYKEIF